MFIVFLLASNKPIILVKVYTCRTYLLLYASDNEI